MPSFKRWCMRKRIATPFQPVGIYPMATEFGRRQLPQDLPKSCYTVLHRLRLGYKCFIELFEPFRRERKRCVERLPPPPLHYLYTGVSANGGHRAQPGGPSHSVPYFLSQSPVPHGHLSLPPLGNDFVKMPRIRPSSDRAHVPLMKGTSLMIMTVRKSITKILQIRTKVFCCFLLSLREH